MIMGYNAYEAASIDIADLRSLMRPKNNSADLDIIRDRHALINKSRDVIRNNSLGLSILKTQVDFLCDKSFDPLCEKELFEIWTDWCANAGVDGYSSWVDIYRDICGAQITDGEVLVNTTMINGDIKVELVEAERIPNVCKREVVNIVDASGNFIPKEIRVTDGVVFDENGKEVGYYVCPVLPDGKYSDKEADALYHECRPNGGGYKSVVLLRRPDVRRPGQTHQVPLLASSLTTVKDIGDIIDAAIKRAYSLSLVSAIIQTDTPEKVRKAFGTAGQSGTEASKQVNLPASGEPTYVGDIAPGSFTTVPWGSKIDTIVPSGSQEYVDLLNFFIRILGAPLALPLELLLKDFSDTSYSSGRLSYDFAYRGRDRWNAGNVAAYVGELFKMVIMNAYHKKDARLAGKSLEEIEYAVKDVKFIGGYNVDIDPLKSAEAQTERLKNETSTQEIELRKTNLSYLDVCISKAEMIKTKREVAAKYGIDPSELDSIIDKEANAGVPNENIEQNS